MASLSFPLPVTILDALSSMGVSAAEFTAYLERRIHGDGTATPALERLRILYLEAQHADGYRRIPQKADDVSISDDELLWQE